MSFSLERENFGKENKATKVPAGAVLFLSGKKTYAKRKQLGKPNLKENHSVL